jgi:hypothetical protein
LLLLLLQVPVRLVLRQRQQQALAHLESAQALLLARQVLRVLNLQRQRLEVSVALQQAEGCSGLHQPAQVN